MNDEQKGAMLRAARVYMLKLEREIAEFSPNSSFADTYRREMADLKDACAAIGLMI